MDYKTKLALAIVDCSTVERLSKELMKQIELGSPQYVKAIILSAAASHAVNSVKKLQDGLYEPT